MKRLFFCVPILACLCSCSAPKLEIMPAPPDLDISFSAIADIDCNGTECTAQMKRISENKWEFCVTEPYPLEGLVIALDDSGTRLSMFDMQSTADISDDAVSAARLISSAFEAAAKSPSEFAVSGTSGFTLTGTCLSGEYKMELDENKTPCKLIIDDADIKTVITAFTELQRDPGDAQIE